MLAQLMTPEIHEKIQERNRNDLRDILIEYLFSESGKLLVRYTILMGTAGIFFGVIIASIFEIC